MEAVKRQIRFQIFDSKKPFTIFWVVVILVDILGYILNYYFDFRVGTMSRGAGEIEINVAGGNIIAIIIFMIVYNILMYCETLPTAIGFSSTRKDFYKGVVMHNIILSFGMAAIEGILLKIDSLIIGTMGLKPLEEFWKVNLITNNIALIIIALFILILTFCSVMNLIGILNYKYGYKFWIGVLILFTLFGNINVLSSLILKISTAFFYNNSIILFLIKVAIINVIFYGISWLLVKKISIKSSK